MKRALGVPETWTCTDNIWRVTQLQERSFHFLRCTVLRCGFVKKLATNLQCLFDSHCLFVHMGLSHYKRWEDREGWQIYEQQTLEVLLYHFKPCYFLACGTLYPKAISKSSSDLGSLWLFQQKLGINKQRCHRAWCCIYQSIYMDTVIHQGSYCQRYLISPCSHKGCHPLVAFSFQITTNRGGGANTS